jgi:two-component system CheB/CheR fusion protein
MLGDESAPQESETEGNSLREPHSWRRYETDLPSQRSVLDLAQEHIAQGERVIARQRELIAELANLGADVGRSESLLATFEALQRFHLAHRDSLARHLEELRKSPFPGERLKNFANIYARNAAEAIETRSLGQKSDRQTSYAEAMIRTIRELLVVVDEELRVVAASRSFYRFFGAKPADTLGRPLPGADAHCLDTPAMRTFLDRVKAGDPSLEAFEIEIEVDAPALGRRVLEVVAEPIHDADATDREILISFSDITEFRRAIEALAAAKQTAEQANLTKSRFLAAASHDLRQPLQAMNLLRAALRRRVTDPQALELIDRKDRASAAIVGMLDSLLDINRLETGAVEPEWAEFPIGELFDTLSREFAERAKSKGLDWRVVPSKLTVRSDRRLLEDMVRNLLSNAIRYTDKGKILLGCRRRGERLRIEVWDTGVGIPEDQIPRVFEEYHQAGGGDRRGGLGLGLAIVQRLGELLAHPVAVRSRLGKGSVFSIESPVAGAAPLSAHATEAPQPTSCLLTGDVLVLEGDPSVREALEAMLRAEGHRVAAAATGQAALDLVAGDGMRPDLVIADYDLSRGIDGLEAVLGLRSALGRRAPAIVLSGDVRAAKQSEIDASDCISVRKPTDAATLSRLVQRLLLGSEAATATEATAQPTASTDGAIFVVDDDRETREAMRVLLTDAGHPVKTYASAQAFMKSLRPEDTGCLITDVRMPGMNGLEMLARLAAADSKMPAIVITGQGDIAMAVQAMRAGAVDFIEKPVGPEALLAALDRAFRLAGSPAERSAQRAEANMRLASLSKRECEVMDLVALGEANKVIAARLGISQRTVETHRAKVMKKLKARSIADLVRLAIAAGE